jgi:FixJ family two-component response regulator
VPQVVSIIDDDESVRMAANSLVRSLGYVTHIFASAEEFLQSPDVHLTSCLIVDVQMPRMNGLELQDALRERGLRIPIIFITAFPKEELKARALEGGAAGFLNKPFDCEALIDCPACALACQRL